MARRSAPTTSSSRSAQARMAVEVRKLREAEETGEPALIDLARERVEMARSIWEGERFLARLEEAVADVPELDELTSNRATQILAKAKLI